MKPIVCAALVGVAATFSTAALAKADCPAYPKSEWMKPEDARARIEAQGNAISASRLGSIQRILVEGRSRNDAAEQMGRTECNRVVNFAAAEDLAGRLIDVRITEVRGHSLRGEPVLA